MNAPITSKAKVRERICPKVDSAEKPLAYLRSMAYGMDIPTANKKQGNTISASPIKSSP